MDPRLVRILEWATENGANVDPNLEFKFSLDRGVYATYSKTLSEPSTSSQLEIPTSLILTNALSDTYFGKTIHTGNPNSSLKLFLSKLKYDVDGWKSQEEKGGRDFSEFFGPYVDLLPVGRASGCLFYWNENELKLLENTNLGGSISLKFRSLVDEWRDALLELPERFQKDINHCLEFHEKFDDLSRDELVNELLDVKDWTSFGAYVWSSFMLTSRSFPNHIINSNVKDGQSILLPLLDLLNHDNSTKICWNHTSRGDEEYFALKSLELLKESEEVFNNYGAKGNEELLMGYGFVIEDNKNDSIALRIKLPIEVIMAAQLAGVKIPKIDDYTYHSFQNNNQTSSDGSGLSEEEIKKGLLYFINRSSLVPDNLLSLFQFLCKKPNEPGLTLRTKLQALQNLRQALDQKEKLIRKEPEAEGTNPEKFRIAMIYRNGQRNLYRLSSSEIKSMEKSLLHEYKTNVLNLKKLYKKDKTLQNLLSHHLNIENYETIESEDMIDAVYFIWLILHGENLSDEDFSASDWITNQYRNSKGSEIGERSTGEFKGLEEFFQHHFNGTEIVEHLTERNLELANTVLSDNSYTRTSTNEIILVEPLEL